MGAEQALGELTRGDHRRQSRRALCHQAILHVRVFADTRSCWRGLAKARDRGITVSAVLPDNFSKMKIMKYHSSSLGLELTLLARVWGT